MLLYEIFWVQLFVQRLTQ